MSSWRRRAVVASVCGLLLLAAAPPAARAQGCILIRENGPVFNPSDRPYAEEHSWQISLSFRGSTADEHYNGTVYQAQRQELGTYVINRQRLLDLSVTYGVSSRFGLTLSTAYVDSSWSIPSPTTPTPGPRYPQHGKGLGDTSLTGHYWLLDTRSTEHNVSVGLGVKAPTGNSAGTDYFPDITGQNFATKAVDYSVQPGDGGWGILFDAQAFQRFGRLFAYGNFSYLANPRDTNGTPSVVVGLGLQNNPALSDVLVNTVPDQYLGRLGVSIGLPAKGLSLSFGGRIEGQPRYDLFGESHGFKRPGKTIYVEPGLMWARGRTVVNVNIPVTVYRDREPNPYTDRPGDATFPTAVVLVGVGYRFK
jgi:hypothetical protein